MATCLWPFLAAHDNCQLPEMLGEEFESELCGEVFDAPASPLSAWTLGVATIAITVITVEKIATEQNQKSFTSTSSENLKSASGLDVVQRYLTNYTHVRIVKSMKPSLREDILKAGLKVMFKEGYQGATVRDICAAAGAPHGSFIHHFHSKEAFAKEVLDRYFANLKEYVRKALEDRSLSPRQRLQRYLEIISGVLAHDKWNRGCLIGDFSIETTAHSKLLQHRLETIFKEWRAPFVSCIAEAQACGEIAATFYPTDLAEFLLASWEGAILRMKVDRGPAPLERFRRIVFATVFQELK